VAKAEQEMTERREAKEAQEREEEAAREEQGGRGKVEWAGPSQMDGS